jgi:hypothetical protein
MNINYFKIINNHTKLIMIILAFMISVSYAFPTPKIEFKPRTYVCCRAICPIVIDGRFEEGAWANAGWTEDFTDIEGSLKPAPRFRTRAKMLWDDEYFYVFAELFEPDRARRDHLPG